MVDRDSWKASSLVAQYFIKVNLVEIEHYWCDAWFYPAVNKRQSVLLFSVFTLSASQMEQVVANTGEELQLATSPTSPMSPDEAALLQSPLFTTILAPVQTNEETNMQENHSIFFFIGINYYSSIFYSPFCHPFPSKFYLVIPCKGWDGKDGHNMKKWELKHNEKNSYVAKKNSMEWRTICLKQKNLFLDFQLLYFPSHNLFYFFFILKFTTLSCGFSCYMSTNQ